MGELDMISCFPLDFFQLTLGSNSCKPCRTAAQQLSSLWGPVPGSSWQIQSLEDWRFPHSHGGTPLSLAGGIIAIGKSLGGKMDDVDMGYPVMTSEIPMPWFVWVAMTRDGCLGKPLIPCNLTLASMGGVKLFWPSKQWEIAQKWGACRMGNSSANVGFSIDMLDYQRVSVHKK